MGSPPFTFGIHFILTCLSADAALLPAKDVLATWISRYEGCRSPSEAAQTLETLARKGVNRIYVDVFANGNAYFQSPSRTRTRCDLVVICSPAASMLRGYTMWDTWAWFEYGLMSSTSTLTAFGKYAQAKGWNIGSHGGFYWMDPQNPRWGTFSSVSSMILCTPICRLGRVQLDDHFATPSGLGQRSAALQALAHKLTAAVDLPVSLAPAAPDFPKSSLQVDWIS